MILDIDVGNTRVKWRLLTEHKALHSRGVAANLYKLSDNLAGAIASVARVRVSCVGQRRQLAEFDRWLKACRGISCEVAQSSRCAVGVTNGYHQPKQLGVDRWLAICAAAADSSGARVIVDAGSALTVDFVAANGLHEGGYIVPGAKLMASALQRDTARVFFREDYVPDELGPGQSTQAAVSHGILLAQIAFIESTVLDFIARQGLSPRARREGGDDWELLLTGGDAALLAQFLTIPSTPAPDLVFQGIEILLP